jgi:hypothetical protein
MPRGNLNAFHVRQSRSLRSCLACRKMVSGRTDHRGGNSVIVTKFSDEGGEFLGGAQAAGAVVIILRDSRVGVMQQGAGEMGTVAGVYRAR